MVTGAGRGLGKAYAHYLAGEGAKVVVNDIGTSLIGDGADGGIAHEVAQQITSAGGQAVASTSSVTTEAGAQEIIGTALDAYGRIDAVVNNAGILRDASFMKLGLTDWQSVLEVHLTGAYLVTHAAWKHFREQQHGRVVVTTSSTALFGNFGQANYGAAKLGLVGFVHTLALEGAKYGITANAISPMGATRMTNLEDSRAEVAAPAKVAPAVAYLCSDECRDSGMTIRAGKGTFARAAIMVARGVTIDKVPTLAEFAKEWDTITDMDGAAPGGGVGTFGGSQ